MQRIRIALAAAFLLAPAACMAQAKSEVVSRGQRFEIKRVMKDEGTTVLLFIQDTSVMERAFLADLEKQLPQSDKVGLDVVRLKDLAAPAAQQYMVKSTPTAIVFDRFAHELARTSAPDEIKAAVRKGQLMGRLKWIDEDDPKAPEFYGAPPEALKHGIPGIVKTMSLSPMAFRMFNIMSTIHFSDGFLKRREHEMIAAYVSSLNKCKF
jgi:hypothetical protein